MYLFVRRSIIEIVLYIYISIDFSVTSQDVLWIQYMYVDVVFIAQMRLATLCLSIRLPCQIRVFYHGGSTNIGP